MIDTGELEKMIERMTHRTNLYKVLKRALSARGRWKNKPRGDPKKGYKASKERA